MTSLRTKSAFLRTSAIDRRLVVSCSLALLLAGCGGGGSDGKKGTPGVPGDPAPTDSSLTKFEDAPGVHLEITGVSGGSLPSGAGGSAAAPLDTDHFAPGDTLSVTFTITKDDGSPWGLSEMSTARILVSGPSFNYQRVLAEKNDVVAASVKVGEGAYRYTFATPIPETYLPPLNDTPAFGPADGELAGESLLGGTYTVGLYAGWNYTVEGDSFRDVGNTTHDFLLGTTPAIAPREVVSIENCNQCHVSLQAHGGLRREPKLCVLCHTAGAEDRNTAAVENGTPGASIDFKVMIHKLHNGAHLPSVNGVATNADGTRNYDATPVPYKLIGFNNNVFDFSGVGFPVMPSAYVSYLYDKTGTTYMGTGGNGPMPRDTGYLSLALGNKLLEDRIRAGVVSCAKCHGDPDGDGDLAAPAQGDLHLSQPGRHACGSCHDDVDWDKPYAANGAVMPANPGACNTCHATEGDTLAVADAHTHPYENPSFNTGITIDITDVSGGTGPGGNHQAGDPIVATFGVTDDAGADIPIATLTRFQMIVVGPSENPQWIVPNANPFDFAFRKSTPFTGTGTITVPVVSAGATAQTVAVVFRSATDFDVLGSVSAGLVGQTIGAAQGSSASVSTGGVSFTITQGATPFANGDRWYFEVVPVASSYTLEVPYDVTLELLGTATGEAQVLAFGNTPARWGRQVVWERTALTGSAVAIGASSAVFDRLLVADAASLATLAVGDRLVVNDGAATEEYLQVGRIQTTDDQTGADLGAADRIWFTRPMRFAHAAGELIQEVTLSSRREGLDYTLATSDATSASLLADRFLPGNRVVASYRTHARFGTYPASGAARLDVYEPAAADSPDIGLAWGDWVGLPFAAGTYRVGMWANKDFTVTPLQVQTTTGLWSDINTDDTTYRGLAQPAVKPFLFGGVTEIETSSIIASGESCNACHSDIQAHGFGRRGLDTCLLCHSTSGLEDGPKYSFSDWYVGATPGVTMDFRTLLHKVHMGEELANASSYVVNGVFLGTPYPVTYDEVVFPAMPGAAAHCETCHGEDTEAWKAPHDRDHPFGQSPTVHEWASACGSCHDGDLAAVHMQAQTAPSGAESCALCHGDGKSEAVDIVHKTR